jgi:hypothetical protein
MNENEEASQTRAPRVNRAEGVTASAHKLARELAGKILRL